MNSGNGRTSLGVLKSSREGNQAWKSTLSEMQSPVMVVVVVVGKAR